METKRALRNSWLASILACSAACLCASASNPPPLGETDAALDLLLTRKAQEILDTHRLRESKPLGASVSASVDISQRKMVIRFGPGVLPLEDDHSLEEMEQYVRNTLEAYALQAGVGEVEIVVLYEGRLYWEHFPRSVLAPLQAVPRQAGGSVLVSASHGLLRTHPGLQWEFQRPERNGILEDLITPGYADELARLLTDRADLTVHRARRGGNDIHSDSMRPWKEMSARYHLKNLLPERTDIWHHFANSNRNDREVLDDIRARPYYANHLGVDGMLSIHTNAGDPVARGSRVHYHPSKPGDRLLADLTLCYMREIINSQDGYVEFPVARSGVAAGHGENSFATMPSVVVEVAFHTNAADAVALQDPVFRTASMKGVEKGYRLFREGKGCVPLKAEPIDGIHLPAGGAQQVDVVFEGYPQYPIELVTTNVGCPPGWKCTDSRVRIERPGAKPSQVTLRCENTGSAPIYWNTQVVDDDGVKSPPVPHWVQCIRGPGSAVASPGVHAGVEAASAG
ncbi:N-acetylmuramoyl-L-alanine amidase [Stenotrophomonas sp. ZAC14A_NAIMI4_1]|uniref:N-acetylmuramoyl-L-alanine amidase n=1 Tax=Stenotrophomonas sp. ZAC14A_NAIMI4_1 TaxID=2072412 RepID=UPI000D53F940|nr:N-acetylmuramoyl-L-alanine amidase [Stenotrophomonas sp. ZAC14A_NAIMI4_1]AWH46508.1 N-acetylmuramoyl-L-alanine amidase [Stenotrophomonas sp. ZAC14A_NAIMI4_1]